MFIDVHFINTQQTKVVKCNLRPKASINKVNDTQQVFVQGRAFWSVVIIYLSIRHWIRGPFEQLEMIAW